jgi:hypothetical protein
LIFSQSALLKLGNRSFRANEYVQALRSQNFKLKDYLPQEEKVSIAITDFTSSVDKWSCSHIHRTAFMSYKIIEALNLGAEITNAAKTSAFLYSWNFAGESPSLLKRDYNMTSGEEMRAQLCGRIKDSADRIFKELTMSTASEIAGLVGCQIGYEQTVNDTPISIAASAIVASDMVDRLCWSMDYWNPRAVNRILRQIKNGELKEIHPSVVSCLVAFLTQSRSSREIFLLVPKHIRNNKELQEFAQSIKNQKIDRDERKVPISALAPGMRLSRPVFAFDGEQVLCEDLILDEDLIWRLWQLSTVRPLNTPLVIREAPR